MARSTPHLLPAIPGTAHVDRTPAAELRWLCLLDDLYDLVERGPLVPATGAWPAPWCGFIARFSERIGAQSIGLGADVPLGTSAARYRCLHPAAGTIGPVVTALSRSPDGFSIAQQLELDAFCGHLHGGLVLRAAVEAERQRVAGLHDVIEALPMRIVLLDGRLNVARSNRACREWMTAQGWPAVIGQRLRLPAHQGAFELALHAFMTAPFTLHRDLQLDGLDVRMRKLAAAAIPHGSDDHSGAPQVHVLLVIRQHDDVDRGAHTPPEAVAAWLQHVHALTPRETAVAWSVARGVPLKAQAALADRSLETVRAQLKAVLRKLGVPDQKHVGLVLLDALIGTALHPAGERLAALGQTPAGAGR